MRIAYFDEAGIAHESQEPYVVVGGVLIHGDTQWHPIEISANSIITSLVPGEIRSSFYFHAYRLFSDHKSFKGLLSAERRFQILRDLVTIIAYYELPISYGAITRSEITKQIEHWKPSERTHMAHQLAFSLCAMGFQGWFYRESSDEVAICVAAKTDEKNRQLHLKQDFAFHRRRGFPDYPLVTLFNFVDALHFASPEESIGLQLADVVSFVVKRHLMGKEDTEEFYKIIEPCIKCDPISALWPIASDT